MDMNQVTLGTLNLAESISFYKTLGFRLIVHSANHYARFELPRGNATFSLHMTENQIDHGSNVTHFEVEDIDKKHAELTAAGIVFDTEPTDESWLWREARFRDPAGNILCLYYAGDNRRYPPWRREG
ncbi:MAG: glyoxalase/bleomycin resistance/extradiol dioxygenase family protein [Kordiimonadales bacterium]|nr:MAG: glyoxalase/bleomycin resistance/extradiol dioxygenase family protein [Kordiimonadales bacterium]